MLSQARPQTIITVPSTTPSAHTIVGFAVADVVGTIRTPAARHWLSATTRPVPAP